MQGHGSSQQPRQLRPYYLWPLRGLSIGSSRTGHAPNNAGLRGHVKRRKVVDSSYLVYNLPAANPKSSSRKSPKILNWKSSLTPSPAPPLPPPSLLIPSLSRSPPLPLPHKQGIDKKDYIAYHLIFLQRFAGQCR